MNFKKFSPRLGFFYSKELPVNLFVIIEFMREGGGSSDILVACSLGEDKIMNFGFLTHLEKINFELWFACSLGDDEILELFLEVIGMMVGIVFTLHKYKKKEREVCLVSIGVEVTSLTQSTNLRCIKISVYSSYDSFCSPKIIKTDS